MRLSKRSSTPPWPGSSRPLSLTPASRFRADCSKSPSWAATGVAAASANATLEAQQIVYEDSLAAVDSLSGVNLDEEAANLLRFQQAYQAAAQMIRVTQELMDTLMNAVRR